MSLPGARSLLGAIACAIGVAACKEPPPPPTKGDDPDPVRPAVRARAASAVPAAPPTACIGTAGAGGRDHFAIIETFSLEAGSLLTFCARLGLVEATRACLSVDLENGAYESATLTPPPRNFYDDPPVGVPAAPETAPAERVSHFGNRYILTSNTQVRVCKRGVMDCSTFPIAGFRPGDLGERLGGPRIPADVDEDGDRVFLVRHEGGRGRQIFGEIYNLWKGNRIVRFPIESDDVVKKAIWLGDNFVFALACVDEAPTCEGRVFDARTGKLQKLEDMNLCCTQHDTFVRAQVPAPRGLPPKEGDDTWVFFDGPGNKAVWRDLKAGKVERRVVLRDPPTYAEGTAFGVWGKKAFVLHGGADVGSVTILDLKTGAIEKRYAAPRCAK